MGTAGTSTRSPKDDHQYSASRFPGTGGTVPKCIVRGRTIDPKATADRIDGAAARRRRLEIKMKAITQ